MTWHELLLQLEEFDPNEMDELVAVEIEDEKFLVKELVFKKRSPIMIVNE